MCIEDGQQHTLTLQIAEVTKPLAPEGGVTAKGHRLVLDDVDANIEQGQTGRRANLHKEGSALIMKVTAKPRKNNDKEGDGVMEVDTCGVGRTTPDRRIECTHEDLRAAERGPRAQPR